MRADARSSAPPAGGETNGAIAALEGLAGRAVARARAAGADHAEALIESGRRLTVRVAGGIVESLKHSATRGLGLRVIVGDRVGFVSSNDLGEDALEDLARHAVALARRSTPDPANGLPTATDLGDDPAPGELGLHDPAVAALDGTRLAAMAHALERAAIGVDPRVKRVDAANLSASSGGGALANSAGLARTWNGTSVSASVQTLAGDRDGRQQSGSYYAAARRLDRLPELEAIAREAARRAAERIGARSVPTARVPVILHPDVAASWLDDLYGACTADAVMMRESWLASLLGEVIASPLVTIVDDGRLLSGVGTSPWDGEGVPTRRNVLVERGRLAMFEYDSYWARRGNTRSTGNASRSYSSTPGIGYHNLMIEAGAESPAAILARVDRGFYMDDQGSYGYNPVTGDYSFQAQGFWIEKGAKAFPVDGVTVAGRSLDMLRGIVAVGNDLKLETSVCAPTLLIGEMTVAGA